MEGGSGGRMCGVHGVHRRHSASSGCVEDHGQGFFEVGPRSGYGISLGWRHPSQGTEPRIRFPRVPPTLLAVSHAGARRGVGTLPRKSVPLKWAATGSVMLRRVEPSQAKPKAGGRLPGKWEPAPHCFEPVRRPGRSVLG